MYGIFDIALDSDITLPELHEVETGKAVVSVQAGLDPICIPEQPAWFHHWATPKGEVCISCARLSDAYLLRFPELVDFVISHSGETVSYFPHSGVPVETVRHLLLDQVIPRILGQRGQLILHAAAVEVQQCQVIAFLGASGKGKSTLASSFHQNGARLITDDCLLLEDRVGQTVAIPNYYGLRLFSDSATALFGEQPVCSPVAHYTEKKRLQLSERSQSESKTEFRLSTIFLLVDEDEDNDQEEVLITPIMGADEMMTMIEQMFVLDTTDKSLVAHQFKNMGKLVSNKTQIYRLKYPRKHAMLPCVRSSIEYVLPA